MIDKNNPKVYIPERPGNQYNLGKYFKNQGTQSGHLISVLKRCENYDWINDWKEAPLWDKNSIEIATRNWFKFMNKKNEI